MTTYIASSVASYFLYIQGSCLEQSEMHIYIH